MDTALLSFKFARMGARLKVVDNLGAIVSLNVRSDRRGEFFEIAPAAAAELDILDVKPADRHLLLLVRQRGEKSKFLCGHDERHWFVAGIPESAPVGTVQQAKEALKPPEVVAAQIRNRVGTAARNRRKNAAFVRQGEWFFLPAPRLDVEERLVLHWEPLRRGGGKPHWAEFCFRTGGESVYVCSRHPNGVVEERYRSILSANPKARTWGWRVMRRNPGVYVRGRVRHSDHATVSLNGWHRVVLNTEARSRAMRNVAFLD
jgi:hypothetical protein